MCIVLTSRQYGVATVWLVATVGTKSSTRKVTRKAIQEVDVQRACGKILEPGAPIALRLQGNLLYGISRVHNQQCIYLATDAKKIQDQMRLYLRNFPGNQLDHPAAKTRPGSDLIEDDPAFDAGMAIPQYDLDSLFPMERNTQKTSSQMSPQSSLLSGSQMSEQGFAVQLNVDHSSLSSRRGSPFGLEGLSSARKIDDKAPFSIQDVDEFGVQGDWGLDIDGDGNIIESIGPMIVDEEPQLPPLPPTQREPDMPANMAYLDERPVFDDEGDVIMQENLFSQAEPFPERKQHVPWQNDEPPARLLSARRKKRLQIDEQTQVSRNVIRHWQSDYLENCGSRPTRSISATQARRNAMLLTFGLGIGNLGQNIGVPGLVHPLAVEFSGDILFTAITGIKIEKHRGRRRSASEALDSGHDEERRVRPRLVGDVEEQQRARAAQEDELVNIDNPFADGALPEVGREAEHPMSDHLSSTLLPWNRGSSVVPGLSIRRPNPTQQGRDLSSPLGNRGDPQDIVHYSDDVPMAGFGSDGNFGGGFGSADSSFDEMQVPGFGLQGHEPRAEPTADEIRAQSDSLFAPLDTEGRNFANFIQDAVVQGGERRQDSDYDANRKWVAFDDLFVPRATSRLTAAQAFYHTLSLVTKGRMYVEQDGANQTPFGAIWLGMTGVAL
ncbi:Rec8 like protein-domain-containing protein [Nemania sp. NC0429]|nr:Rec8 like protein-domain-containing protein [Nemania sp. NC0429]